MAYSNFKITRLPERMTLYIASGIPAEIGVAYKFTAESTMYLDAYLGIKGEPLDSFAYKIQAVENGSYSDEIEMVVNVEPELGSPVCSSETIDMTFLSRKDITSLFVISDVSDRIRINSIDEGSEITVKGQPIEIGRTYMWYDFKEVVLTTSTPRDGSPAYHSKIHFDIGKASGWTASECIATINKLHLGYLFEEATSYFDSVFIQTFVSQFKVLGGLPGTTVNIRISTDQLMSSFFVNFDSTQETLQTGDNFVSGTLDDTGSIFFTLTGNPTLFDSEEPFGFNIEVELLSIDGSHDNVDNEKDLILLSVYSDIAYIDDFDIIDEIKLTSTAFGSVSDEATANIGTGEDIDVLVDVSIFHNKGTAPFTYEIIADANNPGAAVLTDGDFVNTFNLSTLTGDATGFEYNFTAKIIDVNKIVSTKDFKITVVEAGTVSVPVVSAPTTLSVVEGGFVDVDITASNTPTSYRAEDLPSGLSLDTSTGKISGTITDTVGVHNATLYASNYGGESAGLTFAVTITASSTSEPEITSAARVDDTIGSPLDYQITYTGTAPVTINVTELPTNFIYDSVNEKVIGTIINEFDTFRVTATNAYGTDTLLVLVAGQI